MPNIEKTVLAINAVEIPGFRFLKRVFQFGESKLLAKVKIILKSYCFKILTMEKLDLEEQGKMMLILERKEDWGEYEERGAVV